MKHSIFERVFEHTFLFSFKGTSLRHMHDIVTVPTKVLILMSELTNI